MEKAMNLIKNVVSSKTGKAALIVTGVGVGVTAIALVVKKKAPKPEAIMDVVDLLDPITVA